MKFICCVCEYTLDVDLLPYTCRCGARHFKDGSFQPPMSLEQYNELREKLKLTAFGIPQATIPLVILKSKKPIDLPEEIVQWLNQYEEDQAQSSDKH